MLFQISIQFIILLKHVTALSVDGYQYCNTLRVSGEALAGILQQQFVHGQIPDWIVSEREYQWVNCSRRGLDFVPTKVIPENVEILDLTHNRLRKISSKDFSKYKNLAAIFFDDNCFKSQGFKTRCTTDFYIESGSLKHVPNLRHLSLRKNYLRDFPQDLPKSLTYLLIDFGNFGNITNDLQKYGSNLKALSASLNCQATYKLCSKNFNITSAFSASLEFLDLAFNNWKNLPKHLISPQLETFRFSGNPVKKLFKDDFFTGKNLKILIIDNLGISLVIEIGVFDSLINLEHLDLSGNFLTFIPTKLFRYNTKLQYLDLSLNKLSLTVYNPVYLDHLHMLTYLDVSSNGFEFKTHFSELDLGSSYAKLTSLKVLMIGIPPGLTISDVNFRLRFSDAYDHLSEQSTNIMASLRNLSVVSIAGLSLRSLNLLPWAEMPNLLTFFAPYNQLSFYHSQSNESQASPHTTKQYKTRFKPCHLNETASCNSSEAAVNKMHTLTATSVDKRDNHSCVKVLSYSYNRIYNLSYWYGFDWPEACTVDLSYNHIVTINANDFKSFTNLEVLILNQNPLHKVATDAFSSLSKLQSLFMVNNDLDEDDDSDLSFLTKIPKTANISFKWWTGWNHAFRSLGYWRPEVQGWFDSVVSLDLSENKVPFDIKVFQSLKSFQSKSKLILRNCDIVNSMLSSSFASLSESSLTYVDLGNNKLDQLPANNFVFLKKLKTLKLDHNAISVLEGNFLSQFEHLVEFIVSHNRISYIEPNFFDHTSVKYLDLGFNNIARLGKDILSLVVLNNLEYLDIRGNDLDCTCGVWDTFSFWTTSNEHNHVNLPGYVPKCTTQFDTFFGGCVACQFPVKLKGQSLLSFNSNSHCQTTKRLVYALTFSFSFLFLMLFGTLGYSNWFKRYAFRKITEKFRVLSLNRRTHFKFSCNASVFVIYDRANNEVGDWVDNRLSRAMKNGRPSITLKIVGKDDSCGVAPSQQMLQRIMMCRKTVLILTKSFCSTPEYR